MRKLLFFLLSISFLVPGQIRQRSPTQSFAGAGLPGSIINSRYGDLYINTSTSLMYVCTDVASFCDSVASGEWVLGGGGGLGTVTSVALSLPAIFSVSGSPVTSSGTLTGTLASQSANLVFAAPNGAPGTPLFRALVLADLPSIASTNLSDSSSLVRGAASLSTLGAIPYVTPTGSLAQNAANLFWDISNVRLGVKTNTPAYPLDVGGDGRFTGTLYVGSGSMLITGPEGGTPVTPASGSNSLYFSSVNSHLFRIDDTGATHDIESGGGGSGSTYCSSTTGNDTYACNASPTVSSYTTGNVYLFKADVSNTGAATINFDSVGAISIKKGYGGITLDLSNNDIRAGQIVMVTYDGTNMLLVNQERIGVYTVSGLPASPAAGDLAVVSDPNHAGDCTTGSGNSLISPVLCKYSGSVWESVSTNVSKVHAYAVASGTINSTSLVQYNSSGSRAVSQVSTSSNRVIGVAVNAAVATDIMSIIVYGYASCTFDGNSTTGNLVGVSASTAGRCTDLGTTDISTVASTTQVLGQVADTGTGVGNRGVIFWGGGHFGTLGSGSGSVTGLYTGTINFGSIADGNCSTLTFAGTGATTGMALALGLPSSFTASFTAIAYVSAADTIAIRACNLSGAAVDPASVSFSVRNLDSLGYFTATNTIDPASLADGNCATAGTITLSGAATGDNVAAGWPSTLNAGVFGIMYVSATDTITVRLCNLSGAAVDVASSTFKAAVTR